MSAFRVTYESRGDFQDDFFDERVDADRAFEEAIQAGDCDAVAIFFGEDGELVDAWES